MGYCVHWLLWLLAAVTSVRYSDPYLRLCTLNYCVLSVSFFVLSYYNIQGMYCVLLVISFRWEISLELLVNW